MAAIFFDGRWHYGPCCCCGDPPKKVDKLGNLLCEGCWPHWLKENAKENLDPRSRGAAPPRKKK